MIDRPSSEPEIEGPRRDCIRAKIRRTLVERIVNGEYRPGDRLVELKLAREFATSQGPVREALRELESLRLVESRTYRGTRVRALSESEFWEGAQVRGVLEEMAAKSAATALRDRVDGLRQALDGIRASASEGDLAGYARHNREFHRRIIEASANGVLLRTWDSLMLESLTRVKLSRLILNLPLVAETHVPIVDALSRGDGPEAGRLLREHAEMFGRRPPDRFVVSASAEPQEPRS